jgi:hypothetical protein
MTLYYLLYFFVAVGAKLVMATFTIYLLLPSDRQCGGCDGETLLMQPSGWIGRLGARLSLGRIQWRWCPRCGREGMARRTGPKAAKTVKHTRIRRTSGR